MNYTVTTHDDCFVDYEQVFEIQDSAGNRLNIHTGPVFSDKYPQGHPEHGVWIDVVGEDTPLILISQETFAALAAYIKRRTQK